MRQQFGRGLRQPRQTAVRILNSGVYLQRGARMKTASEEVTDMIFLSTGQRAGAHRRGICFASGSFRLAVRRLPLSLPCQHGRCRGCSRLVYRKSLLSSRQMEMKVLRSGDEGFLR